MSSAGDGSSGAKGRRTSTNMRLEYKGFINADEGLIEARRWIERVTFTKFRTNDFRESLADGVLLCELVVNVASMSIGRINRSSTQYAGNDNIKLFNRACEALGFDKSQLFDVEDLLEVSVKRGQSVLDRAKESQRRLVKVAVTIYWLGKYANDKLEFTGSSVLKEECFQHLLENKLPELPVLEDADVGRRASHFEPVEAVLQESTETTPEKEKNEIVTETVTYSTKREAFKQLEQESLKQAEEDEEQRSRRRSFSSGDKENDSDFEEALKRRKSLGSGGNPLYKEGDSKYKHKKEILGGLKDPVKTRRERIEQGSSSTDSSPSKQPVTLRSPVDLQKKKTKFEEMHRQASEDSEVLQGKRTRPKSWVAGDSRSRGASLKDKTNKFEHLQKQADKESAVLHGELRMPAVDYDGNKQDRPPLKSAVSLKDRHSKYEKLDKAAQQQTLVLQGRHEEMETDFTYDIGDKVNGPITLPGAVDVKMRDKRKQFETLDYKAQRESSILKLHRGKSFDDPSQNPIPLNTASRRAESMPRPKSNFYEYQSLPPSSIEMEIDRDEILKSEPIQSREMNFSESAPMDMNSFENMNDRGSWRSVDPTPPAPPRGDSLRYTRQDDPVQKDNKAAKTYLYSSFAPPEDPSKEKGKRQEFNYKEFVSYPVTKQRDRLERYNAAVGELSKPSPQKNVVAGELTRKKSVTRDEWIKVRPVEDPNDDIPKRQIKKLWDREPEADEGEPPNPVQPVDTSFDKVEKTTYVPNVQNMRYRDFTAVPKKTSVTSKTSVVLARAPVVEMSAATRRKSENRKEPFSNFAQQATEDPNQPAKKQSMSYRDFVVPPPKAQPIEESASKAEKVKSLTRRFMEIEADQNKPKSTGPPALKPVVDRDELVRSERESRSRSWYGVDDEEFEGAARRRVRRWSDYEYEEGARNSAPGNQEPFQNGDMNARESQAHPDVFEEPEPYKKPSYEPEIEVKQHVPMESSDKEWHELRPPPVPPPPAEETEIQPQITKPVKSILKHDPVNHYDEPVVPEPKPFHVEEERPQSVEAPGTRTYQQPRPVHTHSRNIGSRSWNDFESSVRKKSMELLEHRPAAKPHEPREAPKVESEPYKLKRPTDYLPKQHRDQAPNITKPVSQTSYQQPVAQVTHEYHYESKPIQQDYESQRPSHGSMPTSYPTYYEPDVNAGNSPAVVETGMPLFVAAKLHDEDEVQASKSPSADHAYDLEATEKVTPSEVQSNVESVPHDFKAQQKLWEYKTTQSNTEPEEEPHEQPHEQPEMDKIQVKEQEVEKHEVHKYVVDPDSHTIQKNEPEKLEELPIQKPKRPQVFAIVGQVHPVRPTMVELPQPTTISLDQIQNSPKETSPIPQLVKQTVVLPKEEPRLEEKPRRKVERTPSLPKVFNFGEEAEEAVSDKVKTHKPVPPKEPAPKEQSVIVETVTVVEKGRGLEDDIFKSLDEEEEKLKKNLQDPVYREKLRKEVEEENRKQREDARYLTDLQMQQPLGPKEDNFVQEEEERLRQEQLESVSQPALKKDIYDINANRKDNPIYENLPRDLRDIQVNGLQHSPVQKETPSYPVERKKEEEYAKRDHRHEQERREHERREPSHSGPDREREEEYRRQPERRGRSPHRPSSDRDREEEYRKQQERGGRSPGRPSSDRDREEEYRRQQERRGRSPGRSSSDRDREEEYRRQQERRGRSPGRPSSDRDREEEYRRQQERKGRPPHQNANSEQGSDDGYRRQQELRGRPAHQYASSERGSDDEQRRQNYRDRDRRRGRSADGRYPSQTKDDSRYKDDPRRERDRRGDEPRERDRRERERSEHDRREYERKEKERIEHERQEQEQERIEKERLERERVERERREEEERRERERLEKERIEREQREEEDRRERERLEREMIEREQREEEDRRQRERLERERIEREQHEEEDRRQRERLERERIEREQREEEDRRQRERLERERIEREEQERIERERREQEERERLEREEEERLEKERLESERLEQERLERARIEQERHEQERIEWERHQQERLEQERREQGRERRRVEESGYDQQRREKDRAEDERRKRDQYGRERNEQDRHERDRYERERYDHQPKGQGRRPPNDDNDRHDRHYQERAPRDRGEQARDRGEQARDRGEQARDRGEQERDRGEQARDRGEQARDRGEQATDRGEQARDRGEQARDRGEQARDRGEQARDRGEQARDRGEQARDRGEQERYEHERKEQERRERHRREQEHLTPEEREQHRLDQQKRVHELIAQQRLEEMEQEQHYKEMLSKEQQYLYGGNEQKRKSSGDGGMWEKIEDGSGFDIYTTFVDDERSPIVCTSCGMSIVKDQTMYVRELNQYWHETCFRCVVCHIIFGSKEQQSPLKVTDSLLHCENCFITNEGDKCTEV